eukprot:TRINITY_DN2346_c0_g2_i1.p1 TRINITY_DN2346_c0_g2~~TRINITY_DN2346_c0_g2_i1.p1  ORF type:complete len:493 (-),score=63.28 TRINITY_DN2346_c0_g2_i1:89-1567(-)
MDAQSAFDDPKRSDYVLVLKTGPSVHKRVHVQKDTLSLNSKYFKALFTNKMKESHEMEASIETSAYEAALLYAIIRSLFSGRLTLPSLGELSRLEQGQEPATESEIQQDETRGQKRKCPDNEKGKQKQEEKADKVAEIGKQSECSIDPQEFQVRVYVDTLKLLDKFDFDTKFFEECVDLLKKEKPSVSNACYGLSILGDSLQHIEQLKEYTQSLVDFLVQTYVNFDKSWKEKHFLQLPAIGVRILLESDDLLVSCEATILQALRRWINHSPNERACYLPELLPLVRFPQIDLVYLADYVSGSNNFFTCGCEELAELINGVILYHSFPYRHQHKETGCLPNKRFPADWLKKRAGYKDVEESETIDWECSLDLNNQESKVFYFRGVFYYSTLLTEQKDGEHWFSVKADRLLTSGEDDGRYTNLNIKHTFSAFNYQTNTRNLLRQDCTLSGAGMGYLINKILKLDENPLPYIKLNTEGKKIVHLFSSLKSIQATK